MRRTVASLPRSLWAYGPATNPASCRSWAVGARMGYGTELAIGSSGAEAGLSSFLGVLASAVFVSSETLASGVGF
ncbi:hypothetical protein MASR2M78_16570 [Treponema sp.]